MQISSQKMKQIPPEATPEEADRIARAFWYPPYEMAYYLLANGTRVEAIPEIVKNDIALELHSSDLEDLMRVAGISLTSAY